MYTIFTDGSCNFNKLGAKNIGGYAYVIINEYGIKVSEYVGREENTTNNRMELMAVIKSIEAVRDTEELLINSDSEYVVNAINLGWLEKWKRMDYQKGKPKKLIPNSDLWIKLEEKLRPNLNFKWIKAHTNTNSWNDYVDNLVQGVYKKNFTIINQ